MSRTQTCERPGDVVPTPTPTFCILARRRGRERSRCLMAASDTLALRLGLGPWLDRDRSHIGGRDAQTRLKLERVERPRGEAARAGFCQRQYDRSSPLRWIGRHRHLRTSKYARTPLSSREQAPIQHSPPARRSGEDHRAPSTDSCDVGLNTAPQPLATTTSSTRAACTVPVGGDRETRTRFALRGVHHASRAFARLRAIVPCPADLRVRGCELPSDCAASRSVARPDTPATQLNGPLQGAWQRGRSRPRVEPWAGAEAGLGGGT